MRYVHARLDIADRDEAYRNYIAGVLKIISRNDRIPWFFDIMKKESAPEESAEDIIARIKKGVNKDNGGS